MNKSVMQVLKRSGELEPVKFDKISMRIIPIYNIRDPTYIYYSEIVNI